MLIKSLFLLLAPIVAVAQLTGIGVIPTKAKLEVAGAVGKNVGIFGGDGAGISAQQNNPAIGFNYHFTDQPRNMATGSGWVMYLDMANGNFCFDHTSITAGPNAAVALTRRLTITQDANVSLNSAATSASLYVQNGNLGFPAAVFRGTTYSSYFFEQAIAGNLNRGTYINGGKAGSTVYLNDGTGTNVYIGNGSSKVGINTTTPTDILEVKQFGGRGLALINPNFNYWELFVEKNLTEPGSDMYVYYNAGNLGNFYHGDGLYYNYSDRRVKSNIVPINTALTGVLALRPATYIMKHGNPGAMRSLGLLAQEVQSVFPQLVNTVEGNEHGYKGITDLLTLDYNGLGPLLIKALQEQQDRVSLLGATIRNLEIQIRQAEALLLQKPQQQ